MYKAQSTHFNENGLRDALPIAALCISWLVDTGVPHGARRKLHRALASRSGLAGSTLASSHATSSRQPGMPYARISWWFDYPALYPASYFTMATGQEGEAWE